MSSKIRKYNSGCEKRKKKKKDEQLAQSLKGALDQYFKKGQANEVTNGDQKVDNDNQNTNDLNQNADNDNQNMNYDSQSMKDHNQNVDNDNQNSDDVNIDVEAENCDDNNDNVNDYDGFQNVAFKECDMLDIYDPRNWDVLDSKMRELLLLNGPKRDVHFIKGPKDKLSRQFCATLFTRVLPNGEKCDRSWLVYSKDLDKVFCFCCKLLKKCNPKG